MPTYDYRCPECGDDYSITTTIKEYANSRTPVCGGSHEVAEMVRVYTVPGFTIDGLASDRFHYEDKITANRQSAHERGEI